MLSGNQFTFSLWFNHKILLYHEKTIPIQGRLIPSLLLVSLRQLNLELHRWVQPYQATTNVLIMDAAQGVEQLSFWFHDICNRFGGLGSCVDTSQFANLLSLSTRFDMSVTSLKGICGTTASGKEDCCHCMKKLSNNSIAGTTPSGGTTDPGTTSPGWKNKWLSQKNVLIHFSKSCHKIRQLCLIQMNISWWYSTYFCYMMHLKKLNSQS